jgi:CDP-diacylglycerol--serine O-phosphatidyltransferase
MNTDTRRLAYFLPNIFTALNMACGFGSIIMAFKLQFYEASMLLVLGAFFDLVDGRVARLTGTQSSFGEQFDSLSDLISFGMAPALIFYLRFLSDTGRVGMVVSFAYVLCGALRLARFNANIEKVSSEYFQGLPIPGASTAIIGSILLSLEFQHYLTYTYFKYTAITYIFFYSVLMISNIPFPSFKNSPWVKKHKKQFLVLVFMLIASLFLYEELMLLVIITSYVLLSIFYFVLHRKKFRGIFEWKNDENDEEDNGEVVKMSSQESTH